jgi:hypothetical protein
MKKYLPEGYVDIAMKFPQTSGKEKKKVKGYKLGKDYGKMNVRDIKEKLKMPKALRTVNSKYVKKMKSKLKNAIRSNLRKKKWEKKQNSKKK